MDLYPWQEEALSIIANKNCIISAPTGAGKTKVAYLWADIRGAILNKTHRVFYTAPIKALANEKFWELSEIYGKENVGLQTGDATVNPKAPILICTQEIFTKAYARKKDPARVVVDEFHYIFTDSGRTRAYIDGMKTRMPVAIMSATFGSPERVAEYLKRTTGKDFIVYQTDFRPTSLKFVVDRIYSIDQVSAMSAVLIYVFNTRVASTMAKAIAQRRASQIARRIKITRLATKYKVNLEKFDTISTGVAIYHGRLQYNEKLFIEECIRKRFVDIVVATSALGVGVNLPIETVLFGSWKVPTETLGQFRILTKTEFLQMSGRAGRPDYFETGLVGILVHGLLPYENGADIQMTWKTLLEKSIETPVIKLSIDIERLLSGVSPDEEVEYVIKNSLPEIIDPEEIEQIKTKAQSVKSFVASLSDTTLAVLQKLYTPELDLEQNKTMTELVLNNRFVIASHQIYPLCKDPKGDYYTLLKTYRVAKHLRKQKVEITDFDRLVFRIRALDPWVLVKQGGQNQEEVLI